MRQTADRRDLSALDFLTELKEGDYATVGEADGLFKIVARDRDLIYSNQRPHLITKIVYAYMIRDSYKISISKLQVENG